MSSLQPRLWFCPLSSPVYDITTNVNKRSKRSFCDFQQLTFANEKV